VSTPACVRVYRVHVLEDILNRTRNDAEVKRFSHDGVRFSTASLSVRKDCAVSSFHGRDDNALGDLVVNIGSRDLRVENIVCARSLRSCCRKPHTKGEGGRLHSFGCIALDDGLAIVVNSPTLIGTGYNLQLVE